jgi:hypothetical protein
MWNYTINLNFKYKNGFVSIINLDVVFKMETISKEFLQSYQTTYVYHNFINNHKQNILNAAAKGQTRYPIYKHQYDGYHLINQDTLIQIFKERFPGVSVEYVENTTLSGKKECGIILDWS